MSDTIIMYENGKAVGGEGHPTNANEITFNNEDTDLVSEEVESAIKEVNAKFDKGSVSVTANGVKDNATLLLELGQTCDFSKISKDAKIIYGGYQYALAYLESNRAIFSMTTYGNTMSGRSLEIATASNYIFYNAWSVSDATPPVATKSNLSVNVPPADTVIALYY